MKPMPRPAPLFAVLLLAALALPACSSTQDVLQPSALVGGAAGAQPPASAFALPAAPEAAAPAAVPADARIQFAPLVGAPGGASTPLAARLSARAGARGIALVGSGDASATHIMKGYFSAISEGGHTTVIYVWDVIEPSGTRIHRIQGQAKAPSAGGDGWDDVQPATMEAIADETVDRLAAWLSGRTG